MDHSELHIVALIQRGDKEVFRKLFDLYYKRLLLYAKSYTDDLVEAEDIVQELFYSIWEKKDELVILNSLSSYLFRAVHNRCIQFLRHKNIAAGYETLHKLRMKEAELLYYSSTDFSYTETQLNEIQEIVEKTTVKLPEKTREIFRLSWESHKSHREIAGLLDIQVKTVEYHISKALKIFSTALRDFLIVMLSVGFFHFIM